jgi:hypothetical protein
MGVDLIYSLVFPAGLDLLRSPTATAKAADILEKVKRARASLHKSVTG